MCFTNFNSIRATSFVLRYLRLFPVICPYYEVGTSPPSMPLRYSTWQTAAADSDGVHIATRMNRGSQTTHRSVELCFQVVHVWPLKFECSQATYTEIVGKVKREGEVGERSRISRNNTYYVLHDLRMSLFCRYVDVLHMCCALAYAAYKTPSSLRT